MTALVQVNPETHALEMKLASLTTQLAQAEEARRESHSKYMEYKLKYEQTQSEKEMLECILDEKTSLLREDMIIWISDKQILKYFNGGWRPKMGVKISHEGVVKGFEYEKE